MYGGGDCLWARESGEGHYSEQYSEYYRDTTVSSTVSTSVARDTTVSSTMSTTVASGLGNLVLEPRPYFMLQYIILRERT